MNKVATDLRLLTERGIRLFIIHSEGDEGLDYLQVILGTIADALEICKFITAHNGHGITLEDMGDMFYAVTGVKMDTAEFRKIANRIFSLERSFLVREGITKKDDYLKGKWVKGPVPSGPFKGITIDEDNWQTMLEEYYETRGWDKNTGIPTEDTLQTLDLQDVADELKRMGKIKKS